MSAPLDQVTLKDLSLFAYHGLFDAEAELGQRFYIDVSIGADLSYAERADEADGTVNWAELVDVATKAFTTRRYKLVEAAAAAIANAILDHFQLAETVRVEVRKPSAPVEAIFAYSSVIVERRRKSAETAGELTKQIDAIGKELAETDHDAPASPAKGMQQLEDAHKADKAVKLKNKRTKIEK